MPLITYDGKEYHDLGLLTLQNSKWEALSLVISLHLFYWDFISTTLSNPHFNQWVGIIPDICHLSKKVGLVISILIPLGFTIIPLVIYFSEAYSV